MTIGASIAAVTYIQMMQTGGADALLEYSGAKESKWLERTISLASSWGVAGLLAIQIAPIPVPTAVSVVAGMLAQMNEYTVFTTLMVSKFVQLTIGAAAMKYGVAEGLSGVEYIKKNFKPDEAAAEEKDEKKKD